MRKCNYCNFYSVVPDKSELMHNYASACIEELSRYVGKTGFDTIYFGGGTPSVLPSLEFERILSYVYSNFEVASDAEISAEVNPATLDSEKMRQLKELSVNRLSIGVQSMSDAELKYLGRLHSSAQAAEAIENALRFFENISCDIIFGLPEGTSAAATAERLLSYPIAHISAYILKIEEGTPLFEAGEHSPDDDSVSDLYLQMSEIFTKSGFRHYEISNYARSGFECRHNLKYWRAEEYVGIGAAAHSFFDGERYANTSDIYAYLSSPCGVREVTDAHPDAFEEALMLRLRLSEGYDTAVFPQYAERLLKKAKLYSPVYLTADGGTIRLNERGFLVSNRIIFELISACR